MATIMSDRPQPPQPPVRPAARQAGDAWPASPHARQLSGVRVLVVDDNQDDRMLLMDFLSQQGCRVYIAQDGRDGYTKARTVQPDLILMDIRMPVCDGLGACRLLKADPGTRHIPLIFLTAALLTWLAISTGFTLFFAAAHGAGAESEVLMMKAQMERWIADRQARLDIATQQATNNSGSLEDLAKTVTARNDALVKVLSDFKGVPGAAAALAPAPIDDGLPPIERIYSVRAEQERLVTRAEAFAKTRAERLRLAFRLAGLNPAAFSGGGGSPLASKDPASLAQFLGVDVDFADRIHSAAADLSDMRGLQNSAGHLPFGRPTIGTRESSGFGVRIDPFTHTPHIHTGQDFAG